jgi:hypothetical protein
MAESRWISDVVRSRNLASVLGGLALVGGHRGPYVRRCISFGSVESDSMAFQVRRVFKERDLHGFAAEEGLQYWFHELAGIGRWVHAIVHPDCFLAPSLQVISV